MTAAVDLRARNLGIAAAILIIALVGVGLSLTIPLLSLEMERMGVSNTGIGLNTATAGIASIIAVPFVPRLAARIGIGRVLAAAIATIVLSLVLFRAVPNYWAWFPIRFLFSAALGALFVLSEYWISALAPPARRGLVMGIYATVLALGFALGPAILNLVGTRGWPPYLAGAGLLALASLPLIAARNNLPALSDEPSRPFRVYLMALPAATMAGMVFGAVETGGFALLPVYALRIGFEAEGAAFLVTIIALGNVLMQLPLGLLADKVSKGALLVAVGLLGSLGMAILPSLAGTGMPFLVMLFLWGGVVGGLYTVGLAHLASRFEGPDLAGANAAFVVLYNIGLTAGPPLVGGAMDVSNPHGFAYALSGLLTLVAFAAAYGRFRR
ncbi:MAG: MFS transporter [Bosea sp.]|jgi:MFS family permease|nr:MFS transporter [Bosea sp. (in: a-proteobacteria)]